MRPRSLNSTFWVVLVALWSVAGAAAPGRPEAAPRQEGARSDDHAPQPGLEGPAARDPDQPDLSDDDSDGEDEIGRMAAADRARPGLATTATPRASAHGRRLPLAADRPRFLTCQSFTC